MTQLGKVVLFLLVTVLLAWVLPWGYHFITSGPVSYPFTLYSCVTRSFASVGYGEEKMSYYDSKGNRYTEEQFDSILPTFYYHRLVAQGRFPREIQGCPVTVADIKREHLVFRHTPSDVNKVEVGLYPLLEAMPRRGELEMPGEVFRMAERMEFIEMETNTVVEEKSRMFSQALEKKGFHFPARLVSGNPTTRKEYDEGYWVTDRDDRLFHIKQLCGRPFVREVPLPGGMVPAYLFPTEYPGRRTFCLMADTAGALYVLRKPAYAWARLPQVAFRPAEEEMSIIGDPFYWTIQISGQKGRRLYAVDTRDYRLADTLSFQAAESQAEKIAAWLFPFELSFISFRDKWVFPRLTDFSGNAYLLNLLLAVLLLVLCRGKGRQAAIPLVAVCLLGIYGFVPWLLFVRQG